MSDEIVFDVLCTKVLDALQDLWLGKFSAWDATKMKRKVIQKVREHIVGRSVKPVWSGDD